LILLPAAVLAFTAFAADSACVAIDTPASGAIKQVAVAKLLRFGSHDPIPTSFASFVADAIATHLVLPKPLALGVYSADFPGSVPVGSTEPNRVVPAFSSEFMVSFRRDGTVGDLRLSQQSMAPELDAAIARAIHTADSTFSFPPINDATDKSELVVFIDIDLTDSVSAGTYPLFRVTLPVYPVTRVSTQLHNSDALPRYPDELRSRHLNAQAMLKLVVDESGRMAEHSYRFVALTELPFGQAVMDVLPRLRYTPAMIGSCAVKQLVTQVFDFKIDR